MSSQENRIILKGDTISIIFHEKDGYIEVVFKGISHSQEYRVALDVALKLAKAYQVRNWLFDQREMNVHPADLKWAEEAWVPKSYQFLGKEQKQAFVVSPQVYEQYKPVLDSNATPLIAVFKTPPPARQWLCEQ